MAVTKGASAGLAVLATTCDLTLTIGTEANRCCVLVVSATDYSGATTDSVAFTSGSSDTWTELGESTLNGRVMSIWYCKPVDTGSRTVRATFSATKYALCAVYYCYGVDQTTPVDTYTTNIQEDTDCTVASATGNFTVCGWAGTGSDPGAFTPAADYTESTTLRIMSQAGAATTTYSWANTGIERGAVLANIKAAASAAKPLHYYRQQQ